MSDWRFKGVVVPKNRDIPPKPEKWEPKTVTERECVERERAAFMAGVMWRGQEDDPRDSWLEAARRRVTVRYPMPEEK